MLLKYLAGQSFTNYTCLCHIGQRPGMKSFSENKLKIISNVVDS